MELDENHDKPILWRNQEKRREEECPNSLKESVIVPG